MPTSSAASKTMRSSANRESGSTHKLSLTHRRSVAAALSDEHLKRLRRVQRMSRLMDNSLRIPGIPIRFGLDSVIGLIPGIGDSLTAIASGWLLREAYRLGVPKRTLLKMVGNVALDLFTGTVPILGDVFDVYWKSNLRNTRLLEQHLREF